MDNDCEEKDPEMSLEDQLRFAEFQITSYSVSRLLLSQGIRRQKDKQIAAMKKAGLSKFEDSGKNLWRVTSNGNILMVPAVTRERISYLSSKAGKEAERQRAIDECMCTARIH